MKPELTEFVRKDVVPYHEEIARICDTILASSTLTSKTEKALRMGEGYVLNRGILEDLAFYNMSRFRSMVETETAPGSSTSCEAESVALSVKEQVPNIPQNDLAFMAAANDNEYSRPLSPPTTQAEKEMMAFWSTFPNIDEALNYFS